ncbi:glycoside hydrolase family 6 protein [Solwaraspora sp. WMMD1047]|uniref:glycoside hydrolase family 6 protein n=1 Tax=Solwaraspora sp. WMMD1047 TaxID=3016102 RepID=UPI002417AE0E|nr:glycoside hydrolase family 6 protein [Solwaraspora sp. WMMD1047]MDG4831232.1 glycoside hydrolase family 6 protein [Solwaraspora sp. WMMD1047]
MPAQVQSSVHVDNPYLGVTGYVNPEWRALAAGEPGGDRVAATPTAVWLDSVGSIGGTDGGMGLRAHLDEALAQRAGYIQFVLNNLPGRGCDKLIAEGDFGPAEVARYRGEFIDPIAEILADPSYAALRIITIVEVRALPNLVYNTTPRPTATPACDMMRANGGYVAGIRHALNRLHTMPNVYTYLDVANHAWTGRDDVLGPVAQLLADTVRGTTMGPARLDGFITNTADYAPVTEPFLTFDGVEHSEWSDGNRFNAELPFAQALRARLIALGFSPRIGMLIDTSRNGWGGPDRPTAPSTDPDLDVRVDESRVDRRAHKGNWCNQVGAGLGERPRAVPARGVDAFVWANPPGESDGSASPAPIRGFNRMCDPTYGGGVANSFNPTGAMPGSPDIDEWFPAHFRALLANAHPPLPQLEPARAGASS